MTEEEAKTKWCPFARVVYDGEDASLIMPDGRDAIKRDGRVVRASQNCIASACMAWRVREPAWSDEVVVEFARGERQTVCWQDASKNGWRVVERRAPTGGYCGLAGALR